ncbi:MAG: rRNA pseudouridine synthase [Ignavibacteriales bacterium]|nr:rRNA pseudouridine synthase [Ignavibacteriales bacterium]
MKTQKTNFGTVRLNKFIADAGLCSRRKADELISEGKVKINGSVVTELGTKVHTERDKVFVNGRQVVNLDEPVYIAFNKPKDCITTASDERGRTTVMDYVKVRERIFPIGRLDRNTTGILLLTNDGELANKLMHPRHEIKKAYKATLDKVLTKDDALKLEQGIRLSDGKTSPAEIYAIGAGKGKVIGIIIHEGRNRQVHRMFESFGYVVEKLDRVAYADITYEGLSKGEWRNLTKVEVKMLKNLAGLSS